MPATENEQVSAVQALVEQDGAQLDAEQEREAEEAAFAEGFGSAGGAPAPAENPKDDDDDNDAPDEDEVNAVLADQDKAGAVADPAPEDRVSKMEQRLRAVEGRNGTLLAQNKQLTQRIEAMTSRQAPKQPNVTDMMTAAMAGGEKLKALQKEFPEFADALAEQAKIFGSSVDRHLADMRKAAEAEGGRVTKDEAARMMSEARQLARIDAKYPGWEKTCQTQQFVSWFNAQDEDTKALAQSEEAEDAMTLLDRYVSTLPASKGSLTTGKRNVTHNPQERLKSAITATSSASRAAPRSASDEDDFEAGFRSVRGG